MLLIGLGISHAFVDQMLGECSRACETRDKTERVTIWLKSLHWKWAAQSFFRERRSFNIRRSRTNTDGCHHFHHFGPTSVLTNCLHVATSCLRRERAHQFLPLDVFFPSSRKRRRLEKKTNHLSQKLQVNSKFTLPCDESFVPFENNIFSKSPGNV